MSSQTRISQPFRFHIRFKTYTVNLNALKTTRRFHRADYDNMTTKRCPKVSAAQPMRYKLFLLSRGAITLVLIRLQLVLLHLMHGFVAIDLFQGITAIQRSVIHALFVLFLSEEVNRF